MKKKSTKKQNEKEEKEEKEPSTVKELIDQYISPQDHVRFVKVSPGIGTLEIYVPDGEGGYKLKDYAHLNGDMITALILSLLSAAGVKVMVQSL